MDENKRIKLIRIAEEGEKDTVMVELSLRDTAQIFTALAAYRGMFIKEAMPNTDRLIDGFGRKIVMIQNN